MSESLSSCFSSRSRRPAADPNRRQHYLLTRHDTASFSTVSRFSAVSSIGTPDPSPTNTDEGFHGDNSSGIT
jgi:hypothetical protein